MAFVICLLLSVAVHAASPLPKPRPEFGQATSSEIPIPSQKPNQLVSQAGKKISLQEAIFIGLKSNRTIESACISRYAEAYNLSVEEAQFEPQFSFSGELSQSASRTQHTTRGTVSPQAQLKTPSGAQFKFAWSNGGNLSKELQDWSSFAEFTAEKPLLRGGGVKANLASLQQARLAEKANILRLDSTVAEVIGNIIFSYRDLLLAQEELKLANLAVERAEKLITNNEALIEVGRIAALDIIQTRADLENQRLRALQATQNLTTAKLQLVDLLALDLDTSIIAIEAQESGDVTISIKQLVTVALANRPDYLGQLNVIAQAKYNLIAAENAKLWDLNLFARGRYGLEGGSQANWQTTSEATVGFRVNIELNNPKPQRDYVQASTTKKIAYVRLREIRQGIEKQIRRSANEARLLWKQIKLAETAEELARKAVEVELAKLNAGRSTTFQVQTLEDHLRDREIQLLTARIGYLNALTRLDLQLGTSLQTWGINLKKPGGLRAPCY
ncbi:MULTISPECIES: TolC family protein [unclassified Pseudovibrio]|uniref:TolC family protein n=1 Tax=unclassified Pseudovibrio TaxID=2627060 RepID=UPI0007AE959B|nr:MULTISPECIES: TolC family protein [unclassified Pseudovibrio]